MTGLVSALGTWGLFRHYWVLVKLVLTLIATLILLLHTQPIGRVALAAADRTPFPISWPRPRPPQVSKA